MDEKYIVGISLTYKNLYNGKIRVIDHKGSDKVSGTKELNIQENENDYLKQFTINLNHNSKHISQIGFITNRNKEISVGIKDDEYNIVDGNENKIILGIFGYLDIRINALGCFFVNKKYLIKFYLFGFFVLRSIILNNKEFKKKWDKQYNKLSNSYQFIWKTVNLPDSAFRTIIRFCFI